MTQNEFLKKEYNGEYLGDGIDVAWDILLNEGIATEGELQLVTYINGYNMKAMLDVLEVRTGCRAFYQYFDYEEEE